MDFYCSSKKYIVGKAPHRYLVQVSDTTMMTIDKMMVKKSYFKMPIDLHQVT